ncbi:hypothetical protein FACS1894105_14510 [Clostridia bacterium]|nr:hypothetical protein FACS1894105_14510 [Clostridia bacterium]
MVSLLTGGTCGIYDATAYVEREFMLPFGAGLQLFKRLVLDRIITLDLSAPINLNELVVATA